MTTPKIHIDGVTKIYHARHTVEALQRIDIGIAEGEFVCLVGPSGCGKSTLLRMIGGLDRPSGGSIEIHSRGNGSVPTATVFQSYNVFPWKTILANVRFGSDMAGVARRDGDVIARRWLARMGLADFADVYPPALSGGMLQRVAIARALAVEPEILLMDEPFAALDAQHRRIMQEELLALWQEERRTVVFVTHSLEEAVLLGDRIVVMSARPGRMLAEFTVPFDRPRGAGIRADPHFVALEQEIWDLLRNEVDRAPEEGADA